MSQSLRSAVAAVVLLGTALAPVSSRASSSNFTVSMQNSSPTSCARFTIKTEPSPIGQYLAPFEATVKPGGKTIMARQYENPPGGHYDALDFAAQTLSGPDCRTAAGDHEIHERFRLSGQREFVVTLSGDKYSRFSIYILPLR